MEGSECLIWRPRSYFEPLPLGNLFLRSQPMEVELGAGDGSFLVRYAHSNPNLNFIGVERLLGRLRKIDRKGRRLGLDNVRLIRIEAGYFLEYMLPDASVQAVHTYFPDPWPKRRHSQNRLIDERFPLLAQRVLTPGGKVFLRTDDDDYFNQMRSVFAGRNEFVEVETPSAVASVLTDFESDFLSRGVRTLRASFQLKHQ